MDARSAVTFARAGRKVSDSLARTTADGLKDREEPQGGVTVNDEVKHAQSPFDSASGGRRHRVPGPCPNGGAGA